MALTKTTVGVTNISDLSSTPNATEGLTAAQLQAKFDKTGADLKTYINSTLTSELDTYFGNVSATEFSYLDGVTSAIQTQLDNKKVTTLYSGTSAAGELNVAVGVTLSEAITGYDIICVILGSGAPEVTMVSCPASSINIAFNLSTLSNYQAYGYITSTGATNVSFTVREVTGYNVTQIKIFKVLGINL